MNSKIMIADEVADLLRVDRQRIYELVRQKKIPFIRLGARQYRFESEAIAAWLANGGNTEGSNGDTNEN